ncbi:MAG: DUF4397 domain-containing protein [Lentimicrobiaceae bacterium]|nr:DUF4397 domain-containing protein [Lentimicrobiaceae bacterium]
MKTYKLLLRSFIFIMIILPLSIFGQARVQVIHNSADVAAAQVDVWLNDQLLLDNFAFRTASPFIDAPAGVDFDVVIQPANSTDTTNALARFTYNLMDGETYILVANGIVVPAGYNPATPFDIYVYAMGREAASNAANTDVLAFHGSTDAPVVDVVETGVGAGTIIDNFTYGDFAGYLELPSENYQLDIRGESGTETVATFNAPLADLGLEGVAMTVIASGFLSPENNNNGAAFGLYAVLPAGGPFVSLGNTTGIEENSFNQESLTVYPNPVKDQVYTEFSLRNSAQVSYQLVSSTGKIVKNNDLGMLNENQHKINIDVTNLPSGLYIMILNAGGSQISHKIQPMP